MSYPFSDTSGFTDCSNSSNNCSNSSNLFNSSNASETCDVSVSVQEEIFKLCGACDDLEFTSFNSSNSSCNKPCHNNQRHHRSENYTFTSIVTPLSSLTPTYSDCTGCVEFIMRRRNKVVSLQWEPFSGTLTTNGIAYISVPQTITNLPPYPTYYPIYIIYKGVYRPTFILIDPFDVKNVSIKFYLNTDGTSQNINANDNLTVLGSSISWIVE